MAKGAISVVVRGEYDGKDIDAAIRDLQRLKGGAANAQTGMAGFASSLKTMVGPALLAAGAAAGAMAVKFAVDGVNAFKEDQAAATALATTLGNLGLAHDTARVERFIDEMQRSTGVADDQLRPAFDRLVRSTHNVTEAQRLLSLAMDISAGTGKPLEAVTAALGRAADGSTTALSRLGVGLSAGELKAMSFEQVTAKLGRTFEGQAAAKAGTFEGSLSRLSVAFGELQESFGRGLVEGFTRSLGPAKDGTDKLTNAIRDLEPAMQNLGESVGVTVVSFIKSISKVYEFKKSLEETAPPLKILTHLGTFGIDAFNWLAGKIGDTSDATDAAGASSSKTTPQINALARGYQILADKVREANEAQGAYDVRKGLNAWTKRYTAQAEAAGKQIGFTGGTLEQWLRDRKNDLDGGGTPVEKMLINWRTLARGINDEINGLALNMTGKSQVISGALLESFNSRQGAFKSIVAEQVQTIQNARTALDQYAKSVGDTILGKINFSTETTDAEGKTVPMTPEQIVTAILGDINNQQNAVNAMAGIVTKLPEALAQKLLSLPPTAQIGLANYLSDPANAQLLATLNTNFTNLATTTETLLGIPMANAFTKVGNKSATAMIDEAMNEIKKQAGAFKEWVKDKLGTTITVKVNYDTSGFGGADGNPATPMATGGIVTRPTFALIGEAGPEAVIPLSRGASYGVGGSTVNINVQAGVGDPAAIGRTVVESIRAYERRSGKVFAAA